MMLLPRSQIPATGKREAMSLERALVLAALCLDAQLDTADCPAWRNEVVEAAGVLREFRQKLCGPHPTVSMLSIEDYVKLTRELL